MGMSTVVAGPQNLQHAVLGWVTFAESVARRRSTRSRKLRLRLLWYRYVSRSSALAKTILQGTVNEWGGGGTGQTEEEVGIQH